MNIFKRIKNGDWPLLKILGLRLKKDSKRFDITKEKVFELLEDDSNKVLDVRTPKEIEETEPLVEDAILIDYKSPNFKDTVSKLPKEDIYIVICSGGIRSRGACEIMDSLGFKNIYSLEGGLSKIDDCNAWG